MNIEIKRTRKKEAHTYRTIYIKQSLADYLDKIACAHNTSFNNVVVSIIEGSLKEKDV